MKQNSFIDLTFRPKKEPVFTFRIKPKTRKNSRKAINSFASKLNAIVFSIQGDTIQTAFPKEDFKAEKVVELLSNLIKNSPNTVNSVKLERFYLPRKILKQFPGPGFSIKGIMKKMKAKQSVFLGTSIDSESKNLKEISDKAFELWKKGFDFIKDSDIIENLHEFERKVAQVIEARKMAEKETGRKKAFLFNVSSDSKENMIKKAKIVKKLGGNYVSVKGLNSLFELRRKNVRLIIYVDKSVHIIMDKHKTGLSSIALAKLARILGADIVNIGTGKKDLASKKQVESHIKEIKHLQNILNEKISGIKSSMVFLTGKFDKKGLFAINKILKEGVIIESI